jgi:Fic family protein
MVKTEAIASSRFELLTDTDLNVLKASVGQRVSDVAVEMAAGTRSLALLVAASAKGKSITQKMIHDAHFELMQHDVTDSQFAGKLRTFQNWIEGSNKSPAGASYIPPEPEMVPGLMLDLLKFVNRNDLNPIVHAAIAHAQFEAIHPYADGNGRIGRALISSMLIRAGVATTSVVPLAAALLRIRSQYIDALTDYRRGNAGQIVRVITSALQAAASVGLEDVESLGDLPADIQRRLKLTPDSVTWNVVNLITSNATLSADQAARDLGISLQSALNAIATLESAGVLFEITGRKRERYWVSTEVLELLSDYSDRVGSSVVASLKRWPAE